VTPINPNTARVQQPITTVIMECNHSLGFRESPPAVGERIFCFKCNVPRAITSKMPQWRYKCIVCHTARYFGGAELSAMTFASKHSITNHHTVNVYRGTELIETVGAHHSNGLQIPLDIPIKED